MPDGMPENDVTSTRHTVPQIAWHRRLTDHVMTGAAVLTVVLV